MRAAITGAGLSLVLVLTLSPGLWRAVGDGYPTDTFWSLTLVQRAGLVAVSATMILGLVVLVGFQARALARWLGFWHALLITPPLTAYLFTVLLGLSPQAYYTYYQLIFENLPNQIVIRDLFPWKRVLHVAQMPYPASLAQHLTGLAFWLLIGAGVWTCLRLRGSASPRP